MGKMNTVPEIPDANLLIDRGGNQEVPVPFLAPVDVKNQMSASYVCAFLLRNGFRKKI